MRKILILLLCCLLLVTCVSADNAAPTAELAATVSSDGSCTVHLTMTLSDGKCPGSSVSHSRFRH